MGNCADSKKTYVKIDYDADDEVNDFDDDFEDADASDHEASESEVELLYLYVSM